MKVVIQCSGNKAPNAGTFTHETNRVEFFARPELFPPEHGLLASRPDDRVPGSNVTWRERLLECNSTAANPHGLTPAGELYPDPAYGTLLRFAGAENTYILSAGWGIVRASFLLPDYDITFKAGVDPWKRRRFGRDVFHDFNHLAFDAAGHTPIYCFASQDYLPLYYELTRSLPGQKVVYVAARGAPREDRHYRYIEYPTSTNWQYKCAKDFVAGRIPR